MKNSVLTILKHNNKNYTDYTDNSVMIKLLSKMKYFTSTYTCIYNMYTYIRIHVYVCIFCTKSIIYIILFQGDG